MRNKVLFVCEGTHHLPKAMYLANCLLKHEIKSSVFLPHSITAELETSDCFEYYINDILAIPGFLQRIGLVIFFSHESTPFGLASTKIGFIAKRTGTSVLSIQHGWLQPGFNFYTDLKYVSFSGRGTDNSRAIWHFSEVVNYFGQDGIGCLVSKSKLDYRIPSTRNLNVLLATNFNWNIYSRENIISFLRSILALKQQFPSFNIVHKPHPAENCQNIASELGFYFDIIGLSSESWTSIESALTWADLVISTPSTVVLDSLIKETPVFVFNCDVFKESLADFEGISFRTPDHLLELTSNLLIDHNYNLPALPGFDDSKFLKLVSEKISTSTDYTLSEDDFLKFISYVNL